MEIATTLVLHLAKLGIAYDVVKHDYSHSSLHSAHAAQIPASIDSPYFFIVANYKYPVKLGALRHLLFNIWELKGLPFLL
jgi:hypothetical protein